MGKPVRRLRQIPLYAHLSILFAGLMVLFAVVSGYYQYHFTSRLMMDDAQRQFAQIGAVTAAKVQGLYRPAGSLAEQLAQQQLMVAGSLPARLENLPFLVAGLQGLPAVSSIYVGYDNGDFFLVRRWQDSGELRQRLQPPPGTAWVVQSVSHRGGAARGEYLFFNLHLVELGRRVDPLYRFDPRERPWYGSAQRQNQLIVSQPYLFYTSRKAGVTFSRRAPSGMAVAGVDIELDDLSRLLLQSRVTPDTRMALLNGNGEVLASHKGAPGLIHGKDDGRLPLLAELDATVLQQLHREVQRSGKHNVLLRNAAGEWQGVVTEVPVEGGPLMLLMLAAPHRELLAEAVRLRNHSLLISGVMLLLGVLLAIWLSHFAARSLRRLMKETAKIERFQFDEPVAVNTRIREVAELAGALGEMKATVHRFLGMSMALASETQFSRLLAQLLRTMLDASGAQGGVVYLADESARHLQPVQAEWQGTALEEAGGIGGIELSAAAGHPVALALLHDSRVLSEPLEQLKTDFPGLIDGQNPLTLLVLPLRNRERALLGALVLLVDETEQALSPELLAFCEALSGTAAVALNAQRLLDEQKTLLESIIQLLAGAIDAKSPYTGGHCQRVRGHAPGSRCRCGHRSCAPAKRARQFRSSWL